MMEQPKKISRYEKMQKEVREMTINKVVMDYYYPKDEPKPEPVKPKVSTRKMNT